MISEFTPWIFAAAPITLAVVALFWFFVRGYNIRSGRVLLPFLEFDLANFDALSQVKMFTAISKLCLPEDFSIVDKEKIARESPVILIHVGWNIVCEAYVEKFGHFPDDNSIALAAKDIGGQNSQFVKMYRDIYVAASSNSRSVKHSFAANYLSRAPSLAERVAGVGPRLDRYSEKFIRVANRIATE